MYEQIADTLEGFQPITLKELDSVRLLNRVDTKFLLSQRQLRRALQPIADRYSALEINGTKLNHYRTLYFDTPDFSLYMQHHNGVGNRFKVRSRQYLESNVSFLEVKNKTNKRRTIKRRRQTGVMVTEIGEEARQFLSETFPMDVDLLKQKLWNSFIRITLASRAHAERLTLDLGLTFEVDGVRKSFPDVVIAEVKQARFSVNSDFFQQMRQQQIRRMGFSKYCAGVAVMYPTIKQNLFKERLAIVRQLSGLQA